MAKGPVLFGALLAWCLVPAAALAAPAAPADTVAAAPAAPDSALLAARVVAYYFHGTIRCRTCLAIEAQAEQALRTGLPEPLARGELLWRPVNVEEKRHEHFWSDFKLEGSALVLARVREGEVKGWKVLERVWELVGEREAFLAYVRAETAAALRDGPEPEAR